MDKSILDKIILPAELKEIIEGGVDFVVPVDRKHLFTLTMGYEDNLMFEVAYDVPVEATVAKCKNGAVVNYMDIYMRSPVCFLQKRAC